ncbi:Rrf2 family transcriptional regulator [Desulfuromonas sp. CSMB_57]|jgi:Rrf2 family iron-sulfur cluster assembly transcriptional regulator|uniref:RrF2 family transcriptional regulator n=1 Tax=Desulfuromonas sp. CSMB_57 TaxID=2807629 RepID=UPI001CD7A50B|nr:Rrf2 family transcriptional regulator [Desulfuromonas sp. CSMB_57]
MRISTKAQYAVRAMTRLCLEGEGNPVSSKTLAELEDISLSFLEQILAKLRRGRIIESVRGPGGGFVLARPAADIRMHEIIECVEESLVPVACMDENGRCNCGDQCLTHLVWAGLAQRIRNFLASMSLADLTSEARGANIFSMGEEQQ